MMIKKLLLTSLLIFLLIGNCFAATELDYMEYATNAAAQAAYVSSDSGVQDFTTYVETDPGADLAVAAAKITATNYSDELDDYVYKDFGANYFDDLNIDFQGQIESTSVAGCAGAIVLSTGIGAMGSVATNLSVYMNKEASGYRFVMLRGNYAAGSYGEYGDIAPGNVFYYVVTRPAGGATVTLKVYSDAAKTIQVGSTLTLAGFGTTKWRYLYGMNHYAATASEFFNGFIQNMTINILQCYSEATIKQQGSYSLKGIALTTNSLNDTLTRTVSPTIDLTGQTQIKFDIYASRTGANIKIGIHDSGGTTSEKTYTVLSANTWETVTWDISAVVDADKNAIDWIKATILDADAANTFYVDNMFGEVIIVTPLGQVIWIN